MEQTGNAVSAASLGSEPRFATPDRATPRELKTDEIGRQERHIYTSDLLQISASLRNEANSRDFARDKRVLSVFILPSLHTALSRCSA